MHPSTRSLFAVLALTSGCLGPTRTRGRIVGGTVAGLGTAMVIGGLTTSCEDHIGSLNEGVRCGIDHDIAPVIGGVMIAIGLAILAENELRSLEPDAAGQ